MALHVTKSVKATCFTLRQNDMYWISPQHIIGGDLTLIADPAIAAG